MFKKSLSVFAATMLIVQSLGVYAAIPQNAVSIDIQKTDTDIYENHVDSPDLLSESVDEESPSPASISENSQLSDDLPEAEDEEKADESPLPSNQDNETPPVENSTDTENPEEPSPVGSSQESDVPEKSEENEESDTPESQEEPEDVSDFVLPDEEDFLKDIVICFDDPTESSMMLSERAQIALNASSAQFMAESDAEPLSLMTPPISFPNPTIVVSADGKSAIRFTAGVTPEQRALATEYGFLIARTSVLEANNAELTFDLPAGTFVSGVTYNADSGVDHTQSQIDGYLTFTARFSNIAIENATKYLTMRPYIVYTVEENDVVVYGEALSDSVYRIAKRMKSEGGEAYTEAIAGVIDAVDYAAYNTNSQSITMENTIQGIIGQDPDVMSFEFCSYEQSVSLIGAFSVSVTGENISYEVFDWSPNILTPYIFDDKSCYLMRDAWLYYILVRGEPGTPFTITINRELPETTAWGFVESTWGFTGGHDAQVIKNGADMCVSINKTESSPDFNQKAYIRKGDLSLDLLNVSKMVVRLYNPSEADSIQAYFQIDEDYDGEGTAQWYQPTLPMAHNEPVEYQDIFFDLTYRRGELKTLMLGFGEGGKTLVGDIHIGMISFIPMPKVLCWNFDTDGDTEEWTKNHRIGDSVVQDGVWKLNLLGQENGTDAAIYSLTNAGIDTELYNKLQIRLKNSTSSDKLDVYFTTHSDGNTSFSNKRKLSIPIQAESEEFIEYTVDLSRSAAWNGIFKQFMIALPEGQGEIEIDSICLAQFEVEYPNVIWNFSDNNLHKFTMSNNGAEICQHQIETKNGALVVTRVSEGNGGMFTPHDLQIPTNKYRYLVLGVRSASATAEFRTYFNTSDSYYAENDEQNRITNTRSVTIQKSLLFREYVIDLAATEDGWTSAYTGMLNDLMFSIKESGVFEFEYIGLFTEYQSESATQITVSENAGEYFTVNVQAANLPLGEVYLFEIEYDDTVLQLDDACSLTFRKDISIGTLLNGMEILSLEPGKIRFKFSVAGQGRISGTLNCVRFKATSDCNTEIKLILSKV